MKIQRWIPLLPTQPVSRSIMWKDFKMLKAALKKGGLQMPDCFSAMALTAL